MMHFYAITFALLAAAFTAQANPIQCEHSTDGMENCHEQRDNSPPACNKDFSGEACGACHFWRQCLDQRTQQWIVPCPACDSTSWCNCTAPPGQNGVTL